MGANRVHGVDALFDAAKYQVLPVYANWVGLAHGNLVKGSNGNQGHRSLSPYQTILCDTVEVMAIPNLKRYRITGPEGVEASVMAVLPKKADVASYLTEVSARFDWKAYSEMQAKQFKVRVGQQKQKKGK